MVIWQKEFRKADKLHILVGESQTQGGSAQGRRETCPRHIFKDVLDFKVCILKNDVYSGAKVKKANS